MGPRIPTAFLLMVVVAGLLVGPLTAESNFWDEEIRNLTGSCRYRVSYDIPDTILTNTTQKVKVEFVVLQLGGTTKSVKTQNIIMQLDVKGKSLTWTIRQEILELNANDTWGPFTYDFKVLDKDFSLSPDESVTATISITVNFKETGGLIDVKEYDHQVSKNDIRVKLQSTVKPTSSYYLGEILSWLKNNWPFTIMLAVGLAVTVTIVITIEIKIRSGRRR